MFASLPWYDFSATQDFNDSLWLRFRHFHGGEEKLPTKLDRKTSHFEILKSEKLFLTQTCIYDVENRIPVKLQVVATPLYSTDGSKNGTYSSFLVKRKNTKYFSLKDAIGRGRFVANDDRSFSGFHCIREKASVLPLWSGSHVRSMEMVTEGQADWAAIDATTWALYKKYSPSKLKALEIFGRTRFAPAPPIVTAPTASLRKISIIQQTLRHLGHDAKAKTALRALFIEGFRLTRLSSLSNLNSTVRSL